MTPEAFEAYRHLYLIASISIGVNLAVLAVIVWDGLRDAKPNRSPLDMAEPADLPEPVKTKAPAGVFLDESPIDLDHWNRLHIMPHTKPIEWNTPIDWNELRDLR